MFPIYRAVAVKSGHYFHLYCIGKDKGGVYKHRSGPFAANQVEALVARITAAGQVDLEHWGIVGKSTVEAQFARADLLAWRPTEEPFRVCGTRPSNGYGHHGWLHLPAQTFATREEAMAYGQEYKDSNPSHTVYLDQARNPENWQRKGSWQRLWSFKKSPKPVQVTE